MNISAVNCTPIKPEVSFGADYKADYDKVVAAAKTLGDSFTPQVSEEENPDASKTELKSKVGILSSVVVAGIVMYAGGKFAAAKANELFPKLAPTMEKGIKTAANFVKDKSSALTTKDNKIVSNLGKGVSRAESFARNVYKNHIQKGGDAAESMKNLAGAAALGVGLPKIVTVDGNGDGIPDVAQKNINAYRSAMDQMSLVSEVVNAMS